MKKVDVPRPLKEITYARAAVRNMIEIDKKGDTDKLKVAIAFLDMAEQRVSDYVCQRLGIDTLKE